MSPLGRARTGSPPPLWARRHRAAAFAPVGSPPPPVPSVVRATCCVCAEGVVGAMAGCAIPRLGRLCA
ncbi:hypothetical protein GUJ93_ZPchr0007g5225 [Zizania palustris]|uniref:Uncharacterized protein n=1 Tax=Zizania palustris TaxID=103762 RepID=A0A8J5SSE4_ZIZPA|nr:hypothetical protein GUJ93_ZPchr0007g5225 [Zizania palustris]